MVKKYVKWKDKAVGVKKLDPEGCERELTLLARAGTMTPERVVAAARSADSALHDGFTWDDTEAANKCRIEEAKLILRAIVVVEERDGMEVEVRAFCNVREKDDEGGYEDKGIYVPTHKAMSDADYREYVLRQALRDAEAYANRYRAFEELARIIKAIDTTVRQYER